MKLLIPIAIALSFTIKGASLYGARTILINISNNVVKTLQTQLASCVLKSDINTLVEHPTETMKTLPGWVAQAILFRAKSKLPVTIMSLDNLPRNGQSLKKIIITKN